MKTLSGNRLWAIGRMLPAGHQPPPLTWGGITHTLWQSPLWTRRRWLRLLGWPGIVGAGLLVTSPLFYFFAVQPAQASLQRAQQSAVSLHERVKLAAAGRMMAPADQLAQFYRLFPNDKNMVPWLEKVFALAQSQGINLDQGEYKVTHDRIGKLTRFQITLPIKSGYPQIRKFLDRLQTEISIVSIEHLQFERQRIDSPDVEAKVVLALYLGHEP